MLSRALCLSVVFLLGLAVGVWTHERPVAGSLGVATASAQGQSIVVPVKIGAGEDNSFEGILGRLMGVANVLMTASARLDVIKVSLGPPPDEGKPALLMVLNTIREECAMIDETAAELEARAR